VIHVHSGCTSPIFSASFNLKGRICCVAPTPWSKFGLTRNFSSMGLQLCSSSRHMAKYLEQITKQSHRERDSTKTLTKNSRKIGHNSDESVGPNKLKFCLALDFGHTMPHTKFQFNMDARSLVSVTTIRFVFSVH